jgi:uncharacterized membrane protein (UPF0127 family)/CheY-like chemotaxis protein
VAKTKLIVNLTRGDALCIGRLADHPLARMRGLMGMRDLPAGEGLLLTPAPAIHTAFMRFPIDALFLDGNHRVVGLVERLRPWRVASKKSARAVLELSAGECARRGVRIGDRLELRERTAVSPRAARTHRASPAARTVPVDTHVPETISPGYARLAPLRVLVISQDHHFRTVMSLLLGRRNCSVRATANASRVTELIARDGVDGGMIDVDESAASMAATVETLARPVGVVLVADERTSVGGQGTLAKWGSFGELVTAIELAEERRGGRVAQA